MNKIIKIKKRSIDTIGEPYTELFIINKFLVRSSVGRQAF